MPIGLPCARPWAHHTSRRSFCVRGRCGSSPRQNGADGWLGGYPGPFSPRCPVCACLLVSSWLPNRATMSQESSLTQSGHSVRQALTAYTKLEALSPLAAARAEEQRALGLDDGLGIYLAF